MRSLPSSWTKVLTQLGFRRRRRKTKSDYHYSRRALFESLEQRQMLAADYVVTTLNDVAISGSTSDNLWSLREALTHAANDGQSDSDSIEFDAALFTSGPKTLLLGDADGNGSIGVGETSTQLTITSDVVIRGPGASSLTIDANDTTRVVQINSGVAVTLEGLTISGGSTTGSGGGVLAYGLVNLEAVVIRGNSAMNGAGVYVATTGSLEIDNATIDDNHASNRGGAITGDFGSGNTLTIINSTISNNTSAGSAGGLDVRTSDSAVLAITNSTFSGNDAANSAGAIWNPHTTVDMMIVNTTITDNQATTGSGGGIFSGGGITLHNTILAGNIAGNTAYHDAIGGLNNSNSSHNMIGVGHSGFGISDGDSAGNMVGSLSAPKDPMLAPLGDYGGPTYSHILYPVSPAAVLGDYDLAIAMGVTSDQRGAPIIGEPAGSTSSGSATANLPAAIYVRTSDNVLVIDDTPVTGGVGANMIELTVQSNLIHINGVSTNINLNTTIVTGIEIVGASGNDIIDLSEIASGDFPSLASNAIVIYGGSGHDVIIGSVFGDTIYGGEGDDGLGGGGGNDTLDGGEGADELGGQLGNDTLRGGGGVDLLFGDAGNDTLDSGGNDGTGVGIWENIEELLLGGTGTDVYVFTDLHHGKHKISEEDEGGVLNLSAWTGIGGYGATLDLDQASEDDEGTYIDHAETVHIEIGTGFLINTVYGTSFNDTIHGNRSPYNFDELFYGGAGNDTIYGYGGNDIIEGQEGNDTLYGNEGSDGLGGGGGDDTLEGGEGADEILGESGNDTLRGGGGIDLLFGDQGNDSLDSGGNDGTGVGVWGNTEELLAGGTGIDTYVFTDLHHGEHKIDDEDLGNTLSLSTWIGIGGYGATLDLEQAAEDDEGTDIDHAGMVHIEIGGAFQISTVYGTPYDDTIIGDIQHDSDEFLYGGAGNDTIYGYGGNDIIEGQEGNDTLSGNEGDDTYAFSDNSNLGTDTIFESIGGGNDSLDFTLLAQGIDLDLLSQVSREVANNQLDLSALFEQEIEIVGGSEFSDTISGNGLSNHVRGFGGDDTISGNGGNDVIHGDTGNDEIDGGSGDDIISGDVGDDTLDGGPGADQVNGDWGNDTFPVENGEQAGDSIADNDQPGPPQQQPNGTLNTAPSLAPISEKTIKAGKQLTFSFQAVDPNGGQALTYSLPGHTSLVSPGGVFTWTPDESDVGVHTFTVKVTDSGQVPLLDQEEFTVKVLSGKLDHPARFKGTSSVSAVSLTWDSVTDAMEYEVRRRRAGTSTWTTISDLTAPSHQNNGLDPGTKYEYQVRAINSVDESDWSPSLFVTTTLPAPTNFSAVVPNPDESTSVDIDFTWDYSLNSSGANPITFIIEEAERDDDWADIETEPVTSRSHTESRGIGAVYFYRIVAVTADATSDYSNIQVVTTKPLGQDYDEKIGGWYIKHTITGASIPSGSPQPEWWHNIDNAAVSLAQALAGVSSGGSLLDDGVGFFENLADPEDEGEGDIPIFQLSGSTTFHKDRPGNDFVFFNLEWSVDTYQVSAVGVPSGNTITLDNWTVVKTWNGFAGDWGVTPGNSSGGRIVAQAFNQLNMAENISPSTYRFVGSFSSDPMGMGHIENEVGYRIDLDIPAMRDVDEESSTNGPIVGVNSNYDEGNTDSNGDPLPDDNPGSTVSFSDNDLIPLTLRFMANDNDGGVAFPGYWRLEFASLATDIRVWRNVGGVPTEVHHNQQFPITLSGVNQAIPLWIEGVDANTAGAQIKAVFSPVENSSSLFGSSFDTNDVMYLKVMEPDLDIRIPGGSFVDDSEEYVPGGFLILNGDDDDEDGARDFEDPQVNNDDDLLEIRLASLGIAGSYHLEFDAMKVRLWADNDKNEKIIPGMTSLSTASSHTLYVEGIAPSTSVGDVTITARAPSAGNALDIIKLTVLSADLDILGEDGTELSEIKEGTVGAFAQYNNDDDDRDNLIDRVDGNGIAGENDLVQMTLRPMNSLGMEGAYELTFDNTAVRIWRNANRTNQVLSGSTQFDETLTTILYVEGYAESEETISLHFVFEDSPPTGGDVIIDEVKVIVAGSILVAIDGTGSQAFSNDPRFPIVFTDGSGIVRTQSHVRNFHDDYYGVAKDFWDGPNNDVFVVGEMQRIHNEVMDFIISHLLVNPNRRVDIVGFSRGGYVAMEVARDLMTKDITGEPIDVRYLGLYDPVDMAAGYGVAETVSANVQTAAVIFASGSAQEIGIDNGIGEERSRPGFNRADHGPESTDTDYDQIWLFGTHAAIGGGPWTGDGPSPGTLTNPALVGHSEANDRLKAIQSDQHVRSNARSKKVPINMVDDYGYQFLDD